MNNPVTSTEIETDQKSLKKQKPMTRWFHRRILSNIQRRTTAYVSKALSKKLQRKEHFQTLSMRPPSS